MPALSALSVLCCGTSSWNNVADQPARARQASKLGKSYWEPKRTHPLRPRRYAESSAEAKQRESETGKEIKSTNEGK